MCNALPVIHVSTGCTPSLQSRADQTDPSTRPTPGRGTARSSRPRSSSPQPTTGSGHSAAPGASTPPSPSRTGRRKSNQRHDCKGRTVYRYAMRSPHFTYQRISNRSPWTALRVAAGLPALLAHDPDGCNQQVLRYRLDHLTFHRWPKLLRVLRSALQWPIY